jgi:ring-1,2-phenylacetyl-CoA epoxidase subunit PaaE
MVSGATTVHPGGMTSVADAAPGPAAVPAGLPDPGEPVPRLAGPTVALFVGSLLLFVATVTAAVALGLPAWVYIPVNTVVSFVMFTVLHDAVHYSISRRRWVNALLARLSMPFVVPYASAPLFGFVHIEHHRNTNEEVDADPDAWATDGPWWQLPFRWLSIDAWYATFYLRNIGRRSGRELAETAGIVALFAAGVVVAALTHALLTVVLVYLVPARLALGLLAWWFDWLPHHGLRVTQRENRYRATRVRVGLEWLLTPALLYQNYHLVHHLHPSIPFYRYITAWRRNEEAYLQRDAAIMTAFGRDLTAEEYRAWRDVESAMARIRPSGTPAGSSAPHAEFHRLPVSAVDRSTPDSVVITFAVPGELADRFRFEAGQHVTVRTDLGGQGVRRNYSICSPATGGPLRIAVKRIPGGAFSGWAATELGIGDTLEVMTPTGRFGPPLDPSRRRHYAAVAAGSGITPILSIVATALEVESESRCTLVYGNRSRGSTMFRAELADLEARFADRLEVLHVLSGERGGVSAYSGRIDVPLLDSLRADRLADVHDWFLCGPAGLVDALRPALLERGVPAERVHAELFHVPAAGPTTAPGAGTPGAGTTGVGTGIAAEVTVRLGGRADVVRLAVGRSVLDGALDVRPDTPYACMGGACGTCRAKVVDGSVEMEHNYALGQRELADGYVLTCQSRPTSPEVTVDYDA